MRWIRQPFSTTRCPATTDDQLAFHGVDVDCRCCCRDHNTFMQICLVYAIISIVEADVEIARYFCCPSLHVLVRHGGKRHQFLSFLHPLVVPAVVLLFEVFMVQCIQFCPKIPVELFQREVAAIVSASNRGNFCFLLIDRIRLR